jgi:uncharacterized protein
MFDTILDDAALARRAAAATARSGAIVARGGAHADRPSQRRSAEPLGSGFAVTTRAAVELRDPTTEGGPLHFHGLASAYGIGYTMFDFWGEYTEIVEPGAGAKSLARADLDVPLVLQHAQLRRIARTGVTESPLFLKELDAGLDVDAPNLDPFDHDVAYIAPKLRSKLIDEMSFAFRIIRGEWSPDWTVYRIHEYDIHRGDVAIVGYGANPHTFSDLRSEQLPPAEPAPELRKRGADLVRLDETRRRPLV